MLDTRFKKIWRDLMERKGRSFLTILGLAIGLWGVVSIAVSWYVLNKDLQANFLSTNPPAMALILERNEPLNIGDFKGIEGISYIENRPQIFGRLEINPDRYLPVVLSVVENFEDQKVSMSFPESGAKAPPKGTILVERSTLIFGNFLRQVYRAGTTGHGEQVIAPKGESVPFDEAPFKISFVGGRDIMAEVSGVVRDPILPPSSMEQTFYGYITEETARDWLGENYNNRLIASPAEGYGDEASVLKSSEAIETRAKELGFKVTRKAYPSATEHVHQFQLNSILFLLGGLGLLALLMSTVLVLNLVNGLLVNQIRQIGVFKAIGASGRQVGGIYYSGMMIIGALASAIAVPLGVRSGYVVADLLSRILNFDLFTLELPFSFLATLFALGVFFPVLAAFLPVRKWSGLTVNEALQNFEIGKGEKAGKLVDKLSIPFSLNVRMGIRNAFRNPKRLVLTALTISVGLAIFMISMNMRSSLLLTAEMEQDQKRYDIVVAFEELIDPDRVSFMDSFPIVERAETWKIKGSVLVNSGAGNPEIIPLKILPIESEVMFPKMMEGVWLEEGEGVVLNHRLQMDNPELKVGSTIDLEVSGKVWQFPIIGVLREFGGPSIYVKDDFYTKVTGDKDGLKNYAYVSLKEDSKQKLGDLTTLLDQHFEMVNVNVVGISNSKTASRVIANHLDIIVLTLLGLAFLMIFVGLLGMASGISTSVVERTREIGILRAIGGKPRAIRSILLSETLVMALLGWILAYILAQPVSRFLTDYFGTVLVEYPFDYLGSTEGVFYSLLGTFLLAVLATLAPAFVAIKQSVREAIAYD